MVSDELWIIRGREPVNWTVPVYVTWQTQEWGILYFAVSLMVKQQHCVEQVLRLAAEPYKAMWRIRRTHLEKIGDLTTGGDPESYFSWERPRLAQQPEFSPERRKERDEFIDAIYQCGVGKSREEVEYWWNQFCKHSLDWLINKEKPVDMYFIRLHNSPYRANWRTALLGRFPRLGALLAHVGGVNRDFVAHKSGLTEQMLSLDLLAMKRPENICYRMVEVEHRPSWWKNVLKVEKTRFERLGCAGYAAYFMESVRSRLGLTLHLYVEWLAHVARPCAADVECGLAGEFRLAPHLPKSDGVPVIPRKSHLVPIVVPNSPPRYSPPSAAKDLYPPHETMPEVPPVQSNPKELRNSRGVLQQPVDRGPATSRLLVRVEHKEPAAGELLAVQPDGRP